MKLTHLRIPADLDWDRRVDRLVTVISKDADLRAHRVTRASVSRMVLYDGLEAIESRYEVELGKLEED